MHKRLWKVCLDDPVSVRPKRSVEWEREDLGRGLRSLLLLSVDCTSAPGVAGICVLFAAYTLLFRDN